MKIHQRDVVEVNYLFPNGITKPHMAIVISNDDLQAAEDFFYLAMISSKNYNPQYTFPLEDSMLTKKLNKEKLRYLPINRRLHKTRRCENMQPCKSRAFQLDC